MATPVILPRQGQSVESCIIGEWRKKVGDAVNIGDILFSYETDKATFEEEAKAEGILLATFFEEGDDVPCLTNVAVIGNAGESFAEFDPGNEAEQSTVSTAASDEVKEESFSSESDLPTFNLFEQQNYANGSRAVSPRARAVCRQMKIDPSLATATGPNGRVIERDIIRLAQELKNGADPRSRVEAGQLAAESFVAPEEVRVSTPVAVDSAEYEEVRLPNIRKVIAKSMHQSLSTMAQLTHNSSFDATAVLEFRKQLKEASEKVGLPNITINDIILYAVSRVLIRHRELNAHYLDDKMRFYRHVHLGIAVDTPRGLLVPTLFNADTKSLKEISLESRRLAGAAQEGNISPDLLAGGTFTVSNLGMLGIESFTPVINPPQTGILGINCIVERVRSQNGQISTYPSMGLSLTYDHRALDGAPASRFLMDLKNALENFTVLLAG